jgi:hypothetical protein
MSFLVRVVLGLAVLGVIATVVVPQLARLGVSVPTLRSQPSRDATDEASLCVGRALDANDRLGGMARRFGRTPIDPDELAAATWDLETEIDDAANACDCPAPACGAAAEALAEMTTQLAELGETVSGDSPFLYDLASRQERIVALLRAAESQL